MDTKHAAHFTSAVHACRGIREDEANISDVTLYFAYGAYSYLLTCKE